MADVKLCKSCIYWLGFDGGRRRYACFCHYLLITGKRRVEVDGICESRRMSKRDPYYLRH